MWYGSIIISTISRMALAGIRVEDFLVSKQPENSVQIRKEKRNQTNKQTNKTMGSLMQFKLIK
jgi:hypothetical protein